MSVRELAVLPIVPPEEFRRLHDGDLLPSLEELGGHMLHALVYWLDAKTEEERRRWQLYFALGVSGAASQTRVT